MRTNCKKIDHEFVKSIKTKDQLVAYLKSINCPALKKLQQQMLLGREYIDGAEVPKRIMEK